MIKNQEKLWRKFIVTGFFYSKSGQSILKFSEQFKKEGSGKEGTKNKEKIKKTELIKDKDK